MMGLANPACHGINSTFPVRSKALPNRKGRVGRSKGELKVTPDARIMILWLPNAPSLDLDQSLWGVARKRAEAVESAPMLNPAAQQLAAADPAGVRKGQGAPPVSMRDNAQPDARAAVQLSTMPLDGLLIK
jgi:hypothetical protein